MINILDEILHADETNALFDEANALFDKADASITVTFPDGSKVTKYDEADAFDALFDEADAPAQGHE